MTRIVRLLGWPTIEVDGQPVARPRGRKSWAVLAFLALSERPVTRTRLAELLFADAEDPLGALRWTLAELRRALGGGDVLSGDPVGLQLDSGDILDVRESHDGPDVTPELLEGLSFPGCDAFESWLLVERRRQRARRCDRLREAAMSELVAGRTVEATRLASLLVELDPLDEAHHTLLVRAFAVNGDRPAARLAADRCAELFRRELGVDPSPALAEALGVRAGAPSARALTGTAAARAQLTAGTAAIGAGAADAGIDCLRRAVDEARYGGDDELLTAALVELGGALVHSVRGRDEEGASVLHEAIERAARSGSRTAATACRELGFVDTQAGRRERADHWLDRARSLASAIGDDRELAAIDGVRGMSLSDRACYPDALGVLTESVDRALSCGSHKQAAWSGSLVGRLHVLRGSYDEARLALDQSLDLIERERWVAFQPWPVAFSAELDVLEGNDARGEQRLGEAFALSCQLADPCWEGVTGRGLGLLEARVDPAAALTRLVDARARCVRSPDIYQWVHGYVLDAACSTAVVAGDPAALRLADELLELAARTDMRELVALAHLHRAALGEAGADVAAQIAAADVDNPLLRSRVG